MYGFSNHNMVYGYRKPSMVDGFSKHNMVYGYRNHNLVSVTLVWFKVTGTNESFSTFALLASEWV